MAESEMKMRDLKIRAQLLKPTIRLGKAGLTAEFVAALLDLLQRAQLVKVRFEGLKEERKSVSKQLAEQTGSLLVQQVGFTAVYYLARKPAVGE